MRRALDEATARVKRAWAEPGDQKVKEAEEALLLKEMPSSQFWESSKEGLWHLSAAGVVAGLP